MSCVSGKPTFRLLDGYVGWDALDFDKSGLSGNGFDDASGIRLKQIDLNAVNPADITAILPPARLARSCEANEWFLAASCDSRSELLHRDACRPKWRSLCNNCGTPRFVNVVALAVWKDLRAVADFGADRVEIWTANLGRRVAVIAKAHPGPLAFTPRGELLVTSTGDERIAVFGLDGAQRGQIKAELAGEVNRIAVDRNNQVWVVTIGIGGSWELWKFSPNRAAFERATAAELASAFPQKSGLSAESDSGFCFDQPSASGFEAATCYSWCGKPLDESSVQEPPGPAMAKKGQLLTTQLDSGIPRCRWHRVHLDADFPQGTSLEVAVATSEDANPASQGDPSREGTWSEFPAGVPHPNDWHTLALGGSDALIDCPPGRYLFFRMRFLGDGQATPVVRRVRIDFPRVTSLERLPGVYRENPRAEDFTERFLSLFDASIGELDRVIERYPALLDATGVPQQLLPWLAGFFDIGLEPTWDDARRRTIIQGAPALYRVRGTLQGLENAINLVFGVKPYIEESTPAGPWGAVGSRTAICLAHASADHANKSSCNCGCNKQPEPAKTGTPPPAVRRTGRLGSVRLFGQSRARFRAGRSTLGSAPLRSYGNPDLDPFASGAYRLKILVPPLPNDSPQERQRLANLIEAQKPAHTVAAVRFGGDAFLLGFTSAVGVDTLFKPLAPPTLGANGNIRLNRQSILWHGAGRARTISVGASSVVGIHTIAG